MAFVSSPEIKSEPAEAQPPSSLPFRQAWSTYSTSRYPFEGSTEASGIHGDPIKNAIDAPLPVSIPASSTGVNQSRNKQRMRAFQRRARSRRDKGIGDVLSQRHGGPRVMKPRLQTAETKQRDPGLLRRVSSIHGEGARDLYKAAKDAGNGNVDLDAASKFLGYQRRISAIKEERYREQARQNEIAEAAREQEMLESEMGFSNEGARDLLSAANDDFEEDDTMDQDMVDKFAETEI